MLIGCVTPQLLGANDYSEQGLVREESNWLPKVALQYIRDPNLNFYGSYARGFKSGGFNSLSYTGENLALQSERAGTVEAGFKSRLFEHTLNFNLTLYQTRLLGTFYAQQANGRQIYGAIAVNW
ncbi:MAG: TonB-dependent receptor [Solimonas sp.]